LIGDIQPYAARMHPLNQRLLRLLGTKSLLAVPLKTKDRILGSMIVDRAQEHSLTQDDLELVTTFAHQAAIALDNASAYQQIEELNVGLEAKVRERTKELEQADRLRSQFLSHVSHELKTPMTSIKGFLQNMLDGLTGAVNDKMGLMEMANNGTLLLDEIGELTPNLQVKLLRVLQDREFRPVGSTKIIKPNFRLISSTNINVESALKEGKLREDLYFRVNTLTLEVPPLRGRPNDIPLLAEWFLQRFAAQHDRNIAGFHPDALRALGEHSWPGNVRELQHVVERAVILAQGSMIGVEDLPAEIAAIKT